MGSSRPLRRSCVGGGLSSLGFRPHRHAFFSFPSYELVDSFCIRGGSVARIHNPILAALFLVVALLFGGSQNANAQAVANSWGFEGGCGSTSLGWFYGSSPEAAGSAWLAAHSPGCGSPVDNNSYSLSGTCTVSSGGSATCTWSRSGPSGPGTGTFAVTISCAAPTSLFSVSARGCIAAPGSCDSTVRKTYSAFARTSTVCIGGCRYTGKNNGGVGVGTLDYFIYDYFDASHVACDGSESVPTLNNKTGTATDGLTSMGCAAGKCLGQVNGVDVCVACSVTSAPAPTSTSSGSAPPSPSGSGGSGGSGAPSESGSTSNVGGGFSSGTTVKTICADSICTTTTTAPGTAGATVKAETQDDYCTRNPRSALCVTSSVVDTGCASVPSCSGDAVQCAILAKQHAEACALAPQAGDTSVSAGNAAVASGTFTGDPRASVTNVGVGSIDQSDLLAGHSCIADKSFTVAGATLNFPMSRLCDAASTLGLLLVGLALLASARIITGGVTS